MRFPPPARFYAPLLVLVFGFSATLLDYELNLSNDLARNLADVSDQVRVTGTRLAKLAERRFAHGDRALLADDLAAWADEPWLKVVAVVDETGLVVADSAARWVGRPAMETPLAPAMRLVLNSGPDLERRQKTRSDEAMIFGKYPIALGENSTGWVLVVFDRTGALAQARADAGEQLRLVAAAIGALCLSLWAALHFGLTARLARLTRMVREFGEGRTPEVVEMPGGDEVRELSAAFATMSTRLTEREEERARLEREVVETTERERRRIGQDLHDGLGQQLTAASLATNGLIAALEDAAPSLAPQGENLGRQLRETIAEVRALSHGLAPVALQEDGLMNALHALADTTERSSRVRCVFECPEPVRVSDAALAGHLYRIAQEAVNNALKHAAPREIRLGLEQRNGTLVLEVDDDGDGLPETLAHGGGIGLRVMRHRAELIGSTFEIGSPPAGGTRIACHIPTPA